MALTDIQQRFADRLAKVISIREHGFQTDLARALGVSRAKIGNIATGRRGSDEDTRRQICAELGVSYEEFMREGDVGRRQGDVITQSAAGGSLAINATRGAAVSAQWAGDEQRSEREQYFWSLFRSYGNPAVLETFIERLEAIRALSQ
jgi:transcriptional regulator with XRE-family HTH domain